MGLVSLLGSCEFEVMSWVVSKSFLCQRSMVPKLPVVGTSGVGHLACILLLRPLSLR